MMFTLVSVYAVIFLNQRTQTSRTTKQETPKDRAKKQVDVRRPQECKEMLRIEHILSNGYWIDHPNYPNGRVWIDLTAQPINYMAEEK